MTDASQNIANRIKLACAVIASCLCVAGFLAWWFVDDPSMAEPAKRKAPAKIMGNFHASLAALDVEENERAARLLREAVQSEPAEPALWANLAVSQLRLNQPKEARESLRRALDAAPGSRELTLIAAQLHQYSGELGLAMEQFRQVHQAWPENTQASYSLVSLLGQVSTEAAESERLELLSDMLRRSPGNLRLLIEQARVAATLKQPAVLTETIEQLERQSESWPADIRSQLADASSAAGAGDFRQAALSLTFFENLMKPHHEYQESLQQLGVTSLGAVGTPVRSMLHLQAPTLEVAEADLELTLEILDPSGTAARAEFVLAMEHPGERRSTLLSRSGNLLFVDESAPLPFPGEPPANGLACVAIADLNADFRQDLVLVGSQGLRIFQGSDNGDFEDTGFQQDTSDRPWHSVWSVDLDAEGDMDLLLSDGTDSLQTIRNRGDGSFAAPEPLLPAQGVIRLCDIDFDQDGDLDLVTLSASGSIHAWQNQRGGTYLEVPLPNNTGQIEIATGDVQQDGRHDLIALGRDGEIRLYRWLDEAWQSSSLFHWHRTPSPESMPAADAFLALADLDNNGALDVVASHGEQTAIWLQSADASFARLEQTPAIQVTDIVDHNQDGLMDLVGVDATGQRVAINRSRANYGWQVIQPMANQGAGDKRINSFGVGGQITVRAGGLTLSRAIESPRVHFGLGRHNKVDVARITWPNGTTQAEFELQSGQSLSAKQRLKGSCPWVFTFNGQTFQFVKDFLWRSPLGLKINAQATAGVTQTEDWIKIAGEQLAAVDGRYQLRITAELWETHFFDHIALLAVDHPAELEVFVDERFHPQQSPDRELFVLTHPQPCQQLLNQRGNRLDEELRSNDGVYAEDFPLGPYQGVAPEHWVAFNLPQYVDPGRPIVVVARGWIYPTDSSLNVAIHQGDAAPPHGLVLEQQIPDGSWKLIEEDLGFPSGKNKDVLIAIPSELLNVSHRFRLRTNMEVYWDSLRWAYRTAEDSLRVTPLAIAQSELRYRGYSRLLPLDRRRPDTPVYEVAGVEPRWLDLEGFYTRFGEVEPLLRQIDDRYVIANAGDELHLEFLSGPSIPEGMRRDFVLVGDGWVKDGDFNTSFSRTVAPLPSHEDADYQGPLLPLCRDPVYQRFPEDWRQYHTRYVTPAPLDRSLWRPQSFDYPQAD